jgi:AraC family transcriptional regulator, transcriptional activator of pobA
MLGGDLMHQEDFVLPNLYSAIRLEGIQYIRVGSEWTFPTHRHSNYEFLYCVQGEMEQWLNGQVFHLYPGDSMIFKPGMYHRTERVSEDTVFFDFHFDVEMQEINSIFQLSTAPVIRSEDGYGKRKHIREWIDRFIAEFGCELKEYYSRKYDVELMDRMKTSVRLLRIHSQVLEFLSLLVDELLCMQELANTNTRASLVQPSQIKIAYDAACLMETCFSEAIRINDLSERLKLHRSYVNQCFKRVFGISPRDYLIKIRIREAKRMLKTTDETIEEISHRLSFSSPAHFSRSFRDVVGISPLEFRKHLNKDLLETKDVR